MPLDAIKKVLLMKQPRRRKIGAVLGLGILFALLYTQLFADPCPLHDRTGAHSSSSAVSCKGLMCLCFPSAFCAPAESWHVGSPPACAIFTELPGGRISRLYDLEIDHPPRGSLPS